MGYFRLFVFCLFGLAAVTARAAEQPVEAPPLTGPTSLLSTWDTATKTAESPDSLLSEKPPLPALPMKKPSAMLPVWAEKAAAAPAEAPRLPLKKPTSLLTKMVVAAEAPATLPGTEGPQQGVFIELALLPSGDAASDSWLGMQKDHPRLLSDFDLTVERADLGAEGYRYRVQAGPLPNQATAKDLCWQLKAEQQDCAVVLR